MERWLVYDSSEVHVIAPVRGIDYLSLADNSAYRDSSMGPLQTIAAIFHTTPRNAAVLITYAALLLLAPTNVIAQENVLRLHLAEAGRHTWVGHTRMHMASSAVPSQPLSLPFVFSIDANGQRDSVYLVSCKGSSLDGVRMWTPPLDTEAIRAIGDSLDKRPVLSMTVLPSAIQVLDLADEDDLQQTRLVGRPGNDLPVFCYLPNRMVQPGDRWEVQLLADAGVLATGTGPGTDSMHIAYTFVGMQDTAGTRVAVIDADIDRVVRLTLARQLGAGAEMVFEGRGTMRYLVDPSTGLPLHAAGAIDCPGRIIAPGRTLPKGLTFSLAMSIVASKVVSLGKD